MSKGASSFQIHLLGAVRNSSAVGWRQRIGRDASSRFIPWTGQRVLALAIVLAHGVVGGVGRSHLGGRNTGSCWTPSVGTGAGDAGLVVDCFPCRRTYERVVHRRMVHGIVVGGIGVH